jgi:hypothetical protein
MAERVIVEMVLWKVLRNQTTATGSPLAKMSGSHADGL